MHAPPPRNEPALDRQDGSRRRRPVSVHGLVVPADPRHHVEVRELTLVAAALSDAIGGGLLDEALVGTYGTDDFTFYLDERRNVAQLPVNDRAAVLSARLGFVRRGWLAGLRGDALVLGRLHDHEDTDVPRSVVDVARAAGLLSAAPPSAT